MSVEIRRVVESDFEQIWPIFQQVVQAGDTYSFAPETTANEARALWMSEDAKTFVAIIENRIVGTYILKPNQPGLGSHVANAAFMVDPTTRSRGIGRAMGEHALEEARRVGYEAMQFNFVVSTNEGAVRLWEKLGFKIVGTLPKVFEHSQLGLVDAYVMHRFL